MITVKTSEASLHCFLALTGHAFTESRQVNDTNCSHGFYWAMRWLATQILGNSWCLWLNLEGGNTNATEQSA